MLAAGFAQLCAGLVAHSGVALSSLTTWPTVAAVAVA